MESYKGFLIIKIKDKLKILIVVKYILYAAAALFQSCPILCDPIDRSPPGSSVRRILQARRVEWVAISFSNTLYKIDHF